MYETKQKSYILEVLKDNKDRQLNCEEIYDLLKIKNYSVGLATIYRYLEKLVNSNIIRKYTSSNKGKAYFQYIDDECKKHNHFHMICLKCNCLIHLDCNEMNEFIKHIDEHHNFKVIPEKIVYYGYCKDCRGEC